MPIIFRAGGGDSNLLSIDISVYSSLDSLPTNLPEGSIAILSNNTFSNFYIDTVAPDPFKEKSYGKYYKNKNR
jgi:hypothetical protein